MKVTLVPTQIIFPGSTVKLTVGITGVSTVIVISFDEAGFPVTHGASDVISQVTTSPLFKELDVNVELFVPEFVPSTFH